jgi:hypothetical protein
MRSALPILAVLVLACFRPDPMAETNREILALAEADSLETTGIVVALQALQDGTPECAKCVLEFELDQTLARADLFLEGHPPETPLKLAMPTIEFGRKYRAENPWDQETCLERCKASR